MQSQNLAIVERISLCLPNLMDPLISTPIGTPVIDPVPTGIVALLWAWSKVCW